MDIDRVRYFCVIANSGSLLQASEIVNISQPALSKAIRLLEEEVGIKLFEREGRGLRLTALGHTFKQRVEPLLEQWIKLPASLESHSISKPIRIGSFEVFTTYFIGYLLGHQKISEFQLFEFTPGSLENALNSGLIDVGITYLPVSKPNIQFVEVTKVRMGVYGQSQQFKNKSFQDIPFVIPNDLVRGTPSKVLGLDGWPDHKYPRKIGYKVTLMESALELCRQSEAIAFLPDFVVRLHNKQVKKEFELQELECPLPLKYRRQGVYLVYPDSSEESPLIRSLAKALRRLK